MKSISQEISSILREFRGFSSHLRTIYMNSETFRAMSEAILELNTRLHTAEAQLVEVKVETHALRNEVALARHELSNVHFALQMMNEVDK